MMAAQREDERTRYVVHHCVLCGAPLTHEGRVCSVRCAQLMGTRERQSADLDHALEQQRRRIEAAYRAAVNTSAAREVLDALAECLGAHDRLMDLWMRGGR